MTFLCDTNIISELARPRPNFGVVDWSQNVTLIAISVITIEEITYGLTANPNARIEDWFQHFLSYSCQILPVTPEIAQCAGLIRGNFRTKGISRSQADILIAATAEVHDLILVTRNTRDFEGCNIKILNPFVE